MNSNQSDAFISSAAGRKRRCEERQQGLGGIEGAAETGGEGRNEVPMIQTIRGLDSPDQSEGVVTGGEGRNEVPMIQTIRGLDSPDQSAGGSGGGGGAFQDLLEELRNFNTRRLFEKINLTDAQFEDWLQKMGLLHSKRTCMCGARMRPRNPLQGRKYGKWRCVNKKCSKEMGYLVGTQFEGSAMPLKEVFQLSYYFARQTHSRKKFSSTCSGATVTLSAGKRFQTGTTSFERRVDGTSAEILSL